MKKLNKIFTILLVLALTFSSTGLINKSYAKSTLPSVSAKAYVIMDANTGKIIYSKNPDNRIYPASTAKMMTALVAIENSSLSKKITVKQNILSQIIPDASKVGLKSGTTYTLEQLLNMLLIDSAADAADTIAEGVAGSKSAFINLMNQKAKSLGMNSTSFDNTIGLDYDDGFKKTYSSAKDIAILTKAAMSNKTIREISGKASYTITNFNNTSSSKTIKNTNKFLTGQYYPKDLYKIIGTKTGWTPAAGNCLATTAVDNEGSEVICAFFGNSRLATMYSDIEKLLTHTFNSSKNNEIILNKAYADAKGHWAEKTLFEFVDKKYLSGYSDGTIKPNNSITRAEFVTLLNSYFGLSSTSGKVFRDTKGHWAKTAIDIAVTNGVCNGVTEEEFMPDMPITREQAAVMIASYKDIIDEDYDKLDKFIDKDKVSSWALGGVECVIELGYMGGYSDNTFKPQDNITRAEAVVTLSRIK